MKTNKNLLNLLSVVLLFFVISCSSGNSNVADEPDIPDTPQTEEEKIKQITKNIDDTRDCINPLFLEAENIFELIKNKDKIEALPSVSQVWNDSTSLFVKTIDGIICFWLFTPEMIDIKYSLNKIKSRNIDLNEKGYNDHEYKEKKNLVIVNQVSNDDNFNNIISTLNNVSSKFQNAGFNISYKQSTEATLNFFKDITKHDMCFLITHGTYDPEYKLHYISTGEEYGEYDKWMGKYYSYFKDNSIAIGTVIEKRNGTNVTKTYLNFNEIFINEHIRAYSNNSILYNTACQSLAGNTEIAVAFCNKGVDVYGGVSYIKSHRYSCRLILFSTYA